MRRERLLLALIVTGGGLIRLAFTFAADRPNLGFNDQFVYHNLGGALAARNDFEILGVPTLRWAPAFPYLLSVPYRIFGSSITLGLVVTALLSTAVIAATHWCVRPLIGARAALAAALIVALLPGQWLFAGTILSEPLSTLLILLVLGVAVRRPPSLRRAVVLGALIGVAALTRGEGPLLGLVVLVAWWPPRRVAGLLGVAAATSILVVTPWVVRNSSLAGEPTGISLNFADTLYAGHNPEADGGATYPTDEILAESASAAAGPEREQANAEVLQDLAVDWAREHPGEELALIPKRLWHLLGGDGDIMTIWVQGGPAPALDDAERPLELIADVAWFAFLAAFAVTLIVRREILRERWARAALVLPACSLVLYGVILYGNVRYRIPFEPLMVLLVTAAWFRPRDWRTEAAIDEPVEAPVSSTA